MLHIRYPFHGAVLNHRHGRQTPQGLAIEVKGIAPLGAAVAVNGVPARRDGEMFLAEVTIDRFENTITAIAQGVQGAAQHQVKVIWDKNSVKRFRISIDDNMFFLQDLVKNKPKSILDNLYLKQLKKLHDDFGAKFTLNLFFKSHDSDFNLTCVPDTWKGQFGDQSDWMRLTWHAYSEFPDRPYQYASAQKVGQDYDLIQGEINRFAGADAWAPPTIVHWGELLPSAYKTLASRGVRALSGYFSKSELRYAVSYGLDEARCAYLENHDALMDFDSGLAFSRIDIIFNNTPQANVIPKLAPLLDDPRHAEYMDLLTHEQYFWPFYRNYVPDHSERIATGLRFLVENGYVPIWQHEGFLGVQPCQ